MKKIDTSNRNYPIPEPRDLPTWSDTRKEYYYNWRHNKLFDRMMKYGLDWKGYNRNQNGVHNV